MRRLTLRSALIALVAMIGAVAAPAWALDAAQARAIAVGDGDARIAALQDAVTRADPGLAAFAQALLDDSVKTTATGVFHTTLNWPSGLISPMKTGLCR